MRRTRALARLGAAALSLAALVPARPAMRLGVNTHFDQGWPLRALGQAEAAHAAGIRDTVSWGKVETRPGVYDFNGRNSGYAGIACARSMPLLLTLSPRNRNYDGGQIVTSDAGRRAFAAYVVALADRLPCLAGVEIGNEINAPSPVWPAGPKLAAIYLPLLRELRAELSARHPQVAVVGGSSLSVATGFLRRLFAAGMLPLVDGVAIHPYVDVPEQLPGQIDRLRAAMARNGGERAIWATEFGLYYPRPEDAPPHAIKVITLLSAAHVAHAFWYALLDEKWFPNTGLYAGTVPKPALDTYTLAARRLLTAGDAHRIDAGDPLTYIYRFGGGPYVMWGGGRRIRFGGDAVVSDSRGRRIADPAVLGPDPVVVETVEGYRLGEPPVLADTLLGYGERPWSYTLLDAAGAALPLGWIDWNWAPYVGRPGFDNFKVTATAISLGRPAAGPATLIEHYASAAPRTVQVSACFAPLKSARVAVRISHHGQQLWAGAADAAHQPPPLGVALGAGDGIDIAYASRAAGGPFMVRRRVRVLAGDQPVPPCPPVPVGSMAAERGINP